MRRTRHSNMMEKSLEEIAVYRVRKIKRFYIHLGIYTIGLLVFLLKEYANAPFNFFPIQYLNWFFMWCWTFILVVKGLKLFMKEVVLGKKWENRIMHKILESEANNQNENSYGK